jgi:hypothetical protein
LSQPDPAQALLETVIAFYDGADRNEARTGPMLEAVCADLTRAAPATTTPRTIAASALLHPALPRTALGASIAATAALFHWRQNPNYSAANMGAAFMAGYGYVEFAGPKDALFHAPDIRVGLLVLGAGLHYPLHAHPAEEIYHPLTDGGLWRQGVEEWRAVPASHPIHHPPMMPHETKAGDTTLLALYCWRGETATEARLTT